LSSGSCALTPTRRLSLRARLALESSPAKEDWPGARRVWGSGDVLSRRGDSNPGPLHYERRKSRCFQLICGAFRFAKFLPNVLICGEVGRRLGTRVGTTNPKSPNEGVQSRESHRQHEAGQRGSSAGDQTGSSAAGRSGASARDESGSSQHGSDNHTTRLSGSQRAGGRESPQSETQTQAPTTIGAGNAPFDTSNGSPSEPGGQANGETSSSQSGADRSTALQDRQFGGN
jgi:hypothetical protein